MNSNGHTSPEVDPPHNLDTIFTPKVLELMRSAVRDAVAEHHREGRPVAISQDGAIVLLMPDGSTRPVEEEAVSLAA